MWSDNDTRRDYLNFRCVADTAAELIVQANGAPLSMGVSGGWGVGKSSMLNLISDALTHREGDEKPYLFVEFNAWLYQGYDDARAALMDQIAAALIERAADNSTALEKAKGLVKRVNWLRFAGLTVGSGVAMAFGLPPMGLIGAGASAIRDMMDGVVTTSDVAGLEVAGKDAAAAGAGLVNPPERETPPAQIAALRAHFRETLEELDTTLVVLIDDLDRCLPSTAISTLEAVRLFLFLPRTAFIIAADEKMIRQAVRVHFKNVELDDDLVTNYFDKLVQVPLRVPPLGTQEVRAYLMLLHVEKAGLDPDETERVRAAVCDRLSASWQGKRVDREFMLELLPECSDSLRQNLELADRLAPLLASAIKVAGNPRLIKRFLNTLWIRLAVARSQGVAVDEATLAKVLLFERCASEDAYLQLVTEVNNADGGRPGFLKAWESGARAGEDLGELDHDWDTPFVRDWLALDPPLADSDLRAVMYVSRETMPIITSADQMSTEALGLLEALLSLTSTNTALRDRLQALPGRNHHLMVDRLLVRARQEQEWGKPPVLFAILALIDAVPEVSKTFVRFLKDLDVARLTAPIVPLLGDKPWAREVLQAWEDADGTPAPVSAAIGRLQQRSS
jgi:predicted KAP-like P-loop ATPase